MSVVNICESLVKLIGNAYPFLRRVNTFIGNALTIMVLYRMVYFVLGMFVTRKFKPAKKKHKYAIVIAARNEKKKRKFNTYGGIYMPSLEWIGKEKVVNHHLEVPYHVLQRQYSYDENGQHEEDNGSENMIIHGDNLLALK